MALKQLRALASFLRKRPFSGGRPTALTIICALFKMTRRGKFSVRGFIIVIPLERAIGFTL